MANKTKVIQIRLSEEDYAVIKNAYKCNLSSYIRELLLSNVSQYVNSEEEVEIRDFQKFKEFLQQEDVALELYDSFKKSML